MVISLFCNQGFIMLNGNLITRLKTYVLFFHLTGVRKRDGNEYAPDTLSGVQNRIDRHLRDKKIPLDIKKDNMFAHSRKVLESKRKELKGQGKGNKKLKAESVDAEEMKMLYDKQLLGAGIIKCLLRI